MTKVRKLPNKNPTYYRLQGLLTQFGEKHSGSSERRPGPGLPRKVRRQKLRKLKKIQKDAFCRKLPVPSLKDVDKKEKLEAKLAERKEKSKKRKKEMKKRKKKQKENLVIKKEEEQSEEITRIQGLREANKKENRLIKELEKNLKLNRRKAKSLPQAFVNDGLDFILDTVDSEKLKALYDEEGEGHDEEGELIKNEKNLGKHDDKSEEMEESELDEESNEDDENEEELSEEDEEEEEEEEKNVDNEEQDSTGSEEEEKLADSEDQDESESDEESPTVKKQKVADSHSRKGNLETETGSSKSVRWSDESKNDSEIVDSDSEQKCLDSLVSTGDTKYKEDIYGRLRDDKGNVVTEQQKYVPPARRKVLESSQQNKANLEKLRKQIKGAINRLSEGNLASILSQMEDLFRHYSSAETCQVLTEVILSATVLPVLVPERLAMEHVLLIAILHSNVGTDVGASFLQTVIQRFHKTLQEDVADSKETDNLLQIISSLCNFHVVNCLLVFDIIHLLVESFTEKSIQLILLLLKGVGFGLRKADPAALKEVILEIQQKAGKMDVSNCENKSHVKYMLDVILAIKNNNMRKIPNYDPTIVEHLRKLQRQCSKGGISAGELRISLADLLKADELGKWWLVGSAWEGRLQDPVARQDQSLPGDVGQKVLDLARKQRMNTDVRRNIFCIIMTSEDYIDAFNKLLRLGQQSEIVHVILDCSLQEKSFNPYYSLLLHKLCQYDRSFKMAVQFSTWDRFQTLDKMSEKKTKHLTLTLKYLISHQAISLAIFKVFEFSELDKYRVRLLKDILKGLLLEETTSKVTEIFTRISPQLSTLREGLKLFIKHFILKKKTAVSPEEYEEFKEKAKTAEHALSGDGQLLM